MEIQQLDTKLKLEARFNCALNSVIQSDLNNLLLYRILGCWTISLALTTFILPSLHTVRILNVLFL